VLSNPISRGETEKESLHDAVAGGVTEVILPEKPVIVNGWRLRASGFGLRASGFGVWGLGLGVLGFGFLDLKPEVQSPKPFFSSSRVLMTPSTDFSHFRFLLIL
jgi:hypothetical protein